MFTLSRGITRALAGGLLTAMVAAASQPAAAAAGDVKVEIDLTGGTTILYYQNDLKVTIDTTSLLTIGAACSTVASPGYKDCPDTTQMAANATVVAGQGLKATGGTSTAIGTTGFDLSNIPLVLENVWAVRALGGNSTSTTVAVTLTANTTLTNATAGSILIKGIDMGTGAAPATFTAPSTSTKNVSFTDPGLVTAQNGYVTLALDLTAARGAGATAVAYKNTTGPQYTIAITNT
jgi:hypothetical protein